MPVPANPKIYHIVHVDRLPSIIQDGHLMCDAEVSRCARPGTGIGMSKIKMRRLKELILPSHPELHIGDCVPFFFCPRPVMLYVIHRGDHSELPYAGGQNPIVHLEADLHQTVAWANEHGLRWAFTLSNAGSYHFQDRRDLSQLDEINWSAVQTDDWSRPDDKEGKQAEFLIENQFPWSLVMRIGAYSARTRQHVLAALESATHNPDVQIIPGWYY
ncbi:MAG: DUF4433 domain-containing protein [Rhodobacteraceae bacterium]|nr:DUF4433 domain-containing protein [Paracoccaceae bacterium]